jgi:hypothetical protein
VLIAAGRGDRSAEARLTAVVWDELHRLAEPYLDHRWFPPADLVDDLWQHLVDGRDVPPACRHRFLLIAARAMRRILADDTPRTDNGYGRPSQPVLDMMRLDEALNELSRVDELTARVVELRYFAGLCVEEAAAAVGIAPDDATARWREGRVWLRRHLRKADTDRSQATAA